MDNDILDNQLVKDVCIEYYLLNKTQQEIADKLFISRSKVSRLLSYAKDNHYITTSLNFHVEPQYKYKDQLEKKYNLDELQAFDITEIDEDFNIIFYKRAAMTIDSFINNNKSVGCSWGSFINEILDYLPKRPIEGLKVIQLFGEITNDQESHNQSTVIKRFAQNYEANFYQLSAPLRVTDKNIKDALLKINIISETMKLLNDVDIILTGVGSIENNGKHSIWDQFQNEEMFVEAIEKGGIGYFCSYIFNKDGEIIDCSYNDCNVAINKEKIFGKKVVLVCKENYKYPLVKALLKSGMVSVLVTTTEIAEKLVAEN